MPFDNSLVHDWKNVIPEGVPGWLEDAESLGKMAEDEPYLEQNLRYLLPWTRAEGHEARVYELRDGALAAYAAFDVGPGTLDVLVGEIALHRHRIERARLSHWAALGGCRERSRQSGSDGTTAGAFQPGQAAGRGLPPGLS